MKCHARTSKKTSTLESRVSTVHLFAARDYLPVFFPCRGPRIIPRRAASRTSLIDGDRAARATQTFVGEPARHSALERPACVSLGRNEPVTMVRPRA
jgi:hypothetical protein